MLLEYVVTVVAALAGRAPPSAGEIAAGGTGKGAGAGGGGWLGRLVQYHKAAFLNDLQDLDDQLVDFEASVEPAPAGYSDAPEWDEGSVLRLLDLVARSRAPSIKPVKRALRRAFRPTRRYMPYIPPGLSSHDLFPSLTGNIENFIYHDYYSEESTSEEMGSEERHQLEWERKHTTLTSLNVTEQEKLAVLVVRNPVEARLPSARISVRLLRKIMEERAVAARAVTPSTKRTRTWLPRSNVTAALKKAEEETTAAPAAKGEGGGNDTSTKAADNKEEGKDEAGGEATTVAAAEGGGDAGAAAEGGGDAGAAAEGGGEAQAEGRRQRVRGRAQARGRGRGRGRGRV